MSFPLTRRSLGPLLAGAAILPFATASRAASLDAPAGKPILTVRGRITVKNVDDTAQFDRSMLESMGCISFETRTPWYSDKVTFWGLPMRRLLEQLGASGDTVVAVALNDYSTEIPVEDFTRYPVLLAIKRDGAYMPVRDKGPLFIVYPYDSSPELSQKKYYSRSAWQVAQLLVK